MLHGTADKMLTFPHGEMLLRDMGGEEGGITKKFFEGQGHVVPIELREEFRVIIEEMVEKVQGLKA